MSAFDDPNISETEPLSTDGRMALGITQPWGNSSYLAAEMGGGEPAQTWRRSMPPAHFPCPLCAGRATATSDPTMIGVMRVACDKGCAEADLREKCRAKVPLAFAYRADLLPEMPNAMIAVIAERLESGTIDQNSHATLGGAEAKAVLRAVAQLRARSDSVAIYHLTNERGGVIGLILRGDRTGDVGKLKSFLQVHVARTAHGSLEARLGLFQGPWPVVGRHTLTAAVTRPVLIVEGEKAREAAAHLIPDYDCVTSMCGADNPHCTDWSPLAGRTVVILRDNDEAGLNYAHAVAAQALSSGAASARLSDLPAGAPPGWDLGDGLPDEITLADLSGLLAEAPELQWEAIKHALRRERSAQDWPPFRLPDGHLKNRKHIVENIEQSLEHINPGCRRSPWLQVLGGVHHALGAEGIPLAIAWSKRDNDKHGKFQPGEVERLFDAWDAAPHPRPMSVRSLFWRAWSESKAASNSGEGWRPSSEAEAEAELADFEATHRKLRQGDNIVIGTQTRAADGSYRIEFLREETVRSEHKARKVPSFDSSKKGKVSIFSLWENFKRLGSQMLVFRPGEQVDASEFNMFQGLTIKPRKGAVSYALYIQLMKRIETENQLPAGYLRQLLAFRYQRLNTFVPVCVVLIGGQGSFKTTFTSVPFRLLAPYSISVSNPQSLVGGNNGALQDKLFVQAEEIELTSDEQNNRLKNYVTNPNLDFHEKYKQQWDGANRSFIMMTSNSRLPVRVPPDNRRFLLLRVSDPFDGDEAKRSELYSRMDAELEAGGYEALAYDLLHEDLTGFNPRVLPATPLSRELSAMDVELEPINSWWREHLELGAIAYGNGEVKGWGDDHNKDQLYLQYVGWSEANGQRARIAVMSKDQWARRLKEMVGGKTISNRVVIDKIRMQVFAFPDHETCCLAFEKIFRCKLGRPDDEPDPAMSHM